MADVTHSPARGFAERSVFWMILVAGVAVTLLIAVLIAFTAGDESAATHAEDAAGHEETGHATEATTAEHAATEAETPAAEAATTEAPAAEAATTEAPAADTATTEAPAAEAATTEAPAADTTTTEAPAAEAVTPTPSGPEGSDNNPLTAN